MQYVIETRHLTRRFGSRIAVNDVGLAVPAGMVTGFLGPNGAGKTTTISMLLGLLRPTSGTITILGRTLPNERREAARRIGALVETPCHYDNLTGRENLEVSRRLLGLDRSDVERVLNLVDLAGDADERVRGYSLGMRQRLGVARAMLGRPSLLILDEPTNGLDPDGIVEFRALIRQLPDRANMSVLLSSHLLAEVEQTVDHIALIWQGSLIVQCELKQLLADVRPHVMIDVSDPARALNLLQSKNFDAEVTQCGAIQASVEAADVPAVNALLVSNGVDVSRLEPIRPSLEAMYMKLTNQGAMREAA